MGQQLANGPPNSSKGLSMQAPPKKPENEEIKPIKVPLLTISMVTDEESKQRQLRSSQNGDREVRNPSMKTF